ncbi:MAG: winged helix-turn-helix transcriptional regulator [Candidatus Thorarchaeota archaeon]
MLANKSSKPSRTEPLAGIFSQLGRPCAVPVILALGEQAYNPSVHEIRQKLGPVNGRGVSKSVISNCISNLTMLGLVQRTDHAISNPEAGYRLTRIGQEFYRHIIQMRYWADRGNGSTELTIDSKEAC